MWYKNISISVKTFYGIEFKPGDIKNVPGYINHPMMVVVDKPKVNDEHKAKFKSSNVKSKKASDNSLAIPSEAVTQLQEEATIGQLN